MKNMNSHLKLSIIMPVYNECHTVEEIVKQVEAVPIKKELIIVDDGSTDGSKEIIQRLSSKDMLIRKCYHYKNLGKGAAVRTGLQFITGDVVIIQDADLEYYPDDLIKIIEPIMQGETKVVYGTRYGDPKYIPRLYLANYLATRLLTIMANTLYGLNITDESTCYKAFHIDVFKHISLRSNRFEFCPEITAKIAKKNYSIKEVSIRYTGRTKEKGKKIGWRDGFMAIWTLVKYRFVD